MTPTDNFVLTFRQLQTLAIIHRNKKMQQLRQKIELFFRVRIERSALINFFHYIIFNHLIVQNVTMKQNG